MNKLPTLEFGLTHDDLQLHVDAPTAVVKKLRANPGIVGLSQILTEGSGAAPIQGSHIGTRQHPLGFRWRVAAEHLDDQHVKPLLDFFTIAHDTAGSFRPVLSDPKLLMAIKTTSSLGPLVARQAYAARFQASWPDASNEAIAEYANRAVFINAARLGIDDALPDQPVVVERNGQGVVIDLDGKTAATSLHTNRAFNMDSDTVIFESHNVPTHQQQFLGLIAAVAIAHPH